METCLSCKICHSCICSSRLRAVSFFCSPSCKTRDTQMATRVNDGALVSRVSRLRRSRARALLSLNLKKKRLLAVYCSRSRNFFLSIYLTGTKRLIHDVRKIPNNSLYAAASVTFNSHSSPLRVKKILHN